MKKKIKLTTGITLINKKYKKKEFYHFIDEPNNVIIIPVIKNKFLLVKQKREPIGQKNYEFPMGWVDKGETFSQTSKIIRLGLYLLKFDNASSEFKAE